MATDSGFVCPAGYSVNDGIDPSHCTTKYASVDDAAGILTKLGSGTLMAKIDISNAYRNIPVHPQDRPLLGMQWKGRIFVDTVLPFGLRSAPKIFATIADCLEWILFQEGVSHCIHYLDDFLTLGPPNSDECQKNLGILCHVCDTLGFPLATEKVEGPNPVITFLGITLDSTRMELRLPPEKLAALKHKVEHWLTIRKATKQQILSLIGHLVHAAKVIPPGRTFIRRMLDVAHSRKSLYHWVRLT